MCVCVWCVYVCVCVCVTKNSDGHFYYKFMPASYSHLLFACWRFKHDHGTFIKLMERSASHFDATHCHGNDIACCDASVV